MLIVTAQPETSPVTREDALAQLRILSASHLDTGQLGLVDDLVEEAVAVVQRQSGLILAPTGYEERFAGWPCGRVLQLGAAPVREVTGVTYLDEDGAEQTVTAGQWSWEPTETGAEVRFGSTWSFPPLYADSAFPVRVAFTAGCGAPDGSEDDPRLALPKAARTAIRLQIEAWFRNPEGRGVLTDAAEALAQTFRIYR
ncbi:hypothetical protein [Phenylobacterium sp.]|uniref:hypothetical protein n=1 Tax=Phenylobacterium sp. TaxID=1871053 RepID=UPI00391DBD5D